MAAGRSSVRGGGRALGAALLTSWALLGACGGSSGSSSAGEFFRELNGRAHVNYVQRATLKDAASAAELAVLGRVLKVADGPILGPAGRGGIPTAVVTASIERVVIGAVPAGDSVSFLVIRGADLDVSKINESRPNETMLILLDLRDDGRFELAGPQGLLVEAGGEVTAPILDDADDQYSKDVKRHKNLDDAATEIRKG